MHGLVVIEGMTLSGHPWIINEIPTKAKVLLILFLDVDVTGKSKPAPLRPNSNINVTYIATRRTFAVCM